MLVRQRIYNSDRKLAQAVLSAGDRRQASERAAAAEEAAADR